MREAQAQAEEKWERRWGRTEEGIRSLLAIAEIHDREIKTLAEAQSANADATAEGTAATVKAITAMAEAIAANAEAVAANAEAQARTDKQMAETDERLNALINVVEQLISERRRNGSSGDTSQ